MSLDGDLPDPNRPLFLCRDCGKYTESLIVHYTFNKCEKVTNYKSARTVA